MLREVWSAIPVAHRYNYQALRLSELSRIHKSHLSWVLIWISLNVTEVTVIFKITKAILLFFNCLEKVQLVEFVFQLRIKWFAECFDVPLTNSFSKFWYPRTRSLQTVCPHVCHA